MFYNNSKNLSALVLILAMSFSLANVSHAQGVVTLVDEDTDELGLSDDADVINDVLVEEESVSPAPENIPVINDGIAAPVNEGPVPAPLPDFPAQNVPGEQNMSEKPVMPGDAINDLNNNVVAPAEKTAKTAKEDFAKAINDIDALENTLEKLTKEDQMPLMAPEAAPNSGRPFVPQQVKNGADVQKAALGDSVLSQIDNELFAQMSDIEKQTTLLSLELRRERLKNEIAAIQAQRQQAEEKAEDERLAREQRKKDLQTEKEIEKIKELQLLEDKKAAYEVLKQEKALNDYKNRMLESEQRWIAENQRLYENIEKIQTEKKEIIADFEKRLDLLKKESAKLIEDAQAAKTEHETIITSLTTQNSQLKKRLEVETSVGKNPFSSAGKEEEISPEHLNLDYVIMEIRGKGDDLIAKLVNANGESFLVKKGSILKTGHVIKRITHNYIALENNGIEDYLQFTAGGVVSQEPNTPITQKPNGKKEEKKVEKRPSLMMDNSIPSLGNGMFVK